MHNFRELNIWKEAMEVATKMYSITADFPAEEKFGITNQIRRAAVSIASNIAEGAGRNSDKSFVQFLAIAFGSANELITQLLISNRLGYLSQSVLDEVIKDIDRIQKMNFRLQEKLKTAQPGSSVQHPII